MQELKTAARMGMELGGRVTREQETAGKTEHLPLNGEPQSGGRDRGAASPKADQV